MKSLPLIIAVAGLMPSLLPGQNLQTQPQSKPGEIVRLWFERWNALDGSEERPADCWSSTSPMPSTRSARPKSRWARCGLSATRPFGR